MVKDKRNENDTYWQITLLQITLFTFNEKTII